jgi:hypothetical protein
MARHNQAMSSPIRPPGRNGPRYAITIAVVLILTGAAALGLVVSDKHRITALGMVGIGYVAGLVVMVAYRDAFIQMNRRTTRTPSWLWVLVGALPVIVAGFLPARSSWPALVFSVFLGNLMGVAVINPPLRDPK